MPKRTIAVLALLALVLTPVLLARGGENKEAAGPESARLKAAAAMDEHDLAEANEIDHARKTVERELAALDAGKLPTSHASARAPVAGTYSVRHRDWQGDVTLYEDGRFGRFTWGEKHRYEGTWTFEDGILTLAWSDWPAVRLEPRLGFEEPGSTMVRRQPRDGPSVRSDDPHQPGEPHGPRAPADRGLRPGK